jgi:hypothetical protein
VAETLENWLKRQLRAVEQSGASTQQIWLSDASSGKIHERWDAPLRTEEGGPGPDGLAEILNEVIDGLCHSANVRQTLEFEIVCMDGQKPPMERARYLLHKKGKSTSTNGAAFSPETAHVAAIGQAQAETTQALLRSANAQIQQQQNLITQLTEQLHGYIQLLLQSDLEKKEVILEGAAETNSVQIELMKQLLEKSGPLIELFMSTMGGGKN